MFSPTGPVSPFSCSFTSSLERRISDCHLRVHRTVSLDCQEAVYSSVDVCFNAVRENDAYCTVGRDFLLSD